MGAAVGSFARSGGVIVPRNRFAPVKTHDDLVVRRSDLYVLGQNAPLEPSPERAPELGTPVVRLDAKWYGSPEDLDLRIPDPLGLVEASTLMVVGDVRFGRGVKVRGRCLVENREDIPFSVPDGAVIGEGS
jgi:UTP--glucose-1-phosphate uridylyltransferase